MGLWRFCYKKGQGVKESKRQRLKGKKAKRLKGYKTRHFRRVMSMRQENAWPAIVTMARRPSCPSASHDRHCRGTRCSLRSMRKHRYFNPVPYNRTSRAISMGLCLGLCLAVCIIGLAYPVTVFDIPVARQVNKRRVDERDQHFKKVL